MEKKLSYPRCYHPKELWEQIEIINQFISLEVDENFVRRAIRTKLPDGAEALFAVPKPNGNYAREIIQVLSFLEDQRRFYSSVQIKPKKICREERTMKGLDILSRSQSDAGDMLVVPAQFGIHYLNRSVDWVRRKMAPNEFGLGIYEVTWMMITHNERENSINGVHVDCPGDTYDSIYNLYFDYGQRWMEIAMKESKRQVFDIGSATGFLSNGRGI